MLTVLIGALFVAAIGTAGVVVTRWAGADDRRGARLSRRVHGNAVVRSVDWRDGEATIALTVTVGRRKPFDAQLVERLERDRAAALHPGTTVAVLVDPSDLQRVELDLDA